MSGHRLKICLAASAGGHLSQLLKVAQNLKNYDFVGVTTTDVVARRLGGLAGRVYVVGECNRQQPWRVLRVMTRCMGAVYRERPDVILSTGAAAGCLVCLAGKIMGARIIWMDSITNIERLSLSGRIIRFMADLFLVQWPELAAKYKNVEYAGSVI
jgi:UDP-N-acetylglucosamine:LPS N-acetylglucosamine transferase